MNEIEKAIRMSLWENIRLVIYYQKVATLPETTASEAERQVAKVISYLLSFNANFLEYLWLERNRVSDIRECLWTANQNIDRISYSFLMLGYPIYDQLNKEATDYADKMVDVYLPRDDEESKEE